jgi:D-alanyl-D-alanine carboxypeptidase (penicillin-binding protein 5/6)
LVVDLGKRTIVLFLAIGLMLSAAAPAAFAAEPAVTAEAYIVMEAVTGRVLAEKNSSAKMPIASTTKILTALLALEQPDGGSYFTVDPSAIKVEGSSMGLREGDQVSLYALACGMLLASGNDAANAAAVRISGSIEAFADRMNERAAEMGMKNSHFVTPSGLHHEEHYSTAADMAVLARHALQNEAFAGICSKPSVKLSYGNPPYTRWLTNHNKLLKQYSGCVGVKTGFTKKAGRCLVSAARREGVTIVCVTLNDPNDWRDHTALLDYGFSQVSLREIPVDVSDVTLRIVGGEQKSIGVKTAAPVSAPLTPEQEGRLERRVLLPAFAYAPVEQGELVGSVQYLLDGFLVAETPLLAGNSVGYDATPPKKSIWEKIRAFWKEHIK